MADVAEVIGGSTPSRSKKEFWNGNISWVVPSELTDLQGRYLTVTNDSITDEGMKSSGLRLIPTGSVLLTSRATIGVTAINAIPVTTNQGFLNLVVKNETDSLWLYYSISSLRNELERRAAGSTFLEVSRDSVRSLPLLLPPLPEQCAIAAVLDSIDEAIERTEAVIASTERLRDALLHDLLTRGVPGWHSEWKEAPGIGTIPASWDVVRLGEVYEVQLGKMLSPKARRGLNPRPYLTNRNVRWGDFDLSDLPAMDFDDREIEKFHLRPGDLLVCEGGDTGRAAVWLGEIADCYYQKALHRLRPICENVIAEFMLAVLMSYAAKGILLEHSERTSISHLTRERLLRMRIPNPSRPEQKQIVVVLKNVARRIRMAQAERDTLTVLKTSAAAALLTGSLRIPLAREAT